MAFNFVEKRFTKIVDDIQSKSTLKAEDVSNFLREIRLLLLEADVNIEVVKTFISDVQSKLEGQTTDFDKTKSQELIKLINEELVDILGGETHTWRAKDGDVVMMVGLQGTGKTTSTAKLTNWLTKKKKFYKKPLLVGLDVYRPAAIDQLEKLAKDNGFQFYSEKDEKDVKRILREALGFAKFNGNDLIVLDTAGRLQTDEELMNELVMIKKETNPKEVMFVADAMSGQELINIAKEFDDKVGLTSAIITKLDSDAKGGAALSLAQMLNLKIRFIGTGEKISDFDLFHPDRMASRILGLGDIETLVEKAEDVGIDENKNEKMMRKMLTGKFDLTDLLESMQAMQKMGPMSSLGNMIPGLKVSDKKSDEAAQKFKDFEVIMNSMTEKEKKNPNLLKLPKRRDRIIKGSGKTLRDYNILLRDFEKAKKQMREMAKLIKSGKMPM